MEQWQAVRLDEAGRITKGDLPADMRKTFKL